MIQFLLSTLLSVSTAQAKDIRPLFEALADSGARYEIVGTVCEQVAKLNLEQDYPAPDYYVVTGIYYGNKKHVIGELDVVVFRSNDNKAVLVGEVKCWTNLSSARSKAMDQRQRFKAALSNGGGLIMGCTSQQAGCSFSKKNFKAVEKFVSISQDGGEKRGFDMTLGYSLEEMMDLREQLMQCQQRGECERP
ncbi:hypothetical protein ACNQKP_05445 [Bdellovibrio bacteriovorus]|uniref:hypothetical protein n=1 Tax=Bdellovibrio bacteriovorus TaxID=959 RepID=UPI003AA9CAF7